MMDQSQKDEAQTRTGNVELETVAMTCPRQQVEILTSSHTFFRKAFQPQLHPTILTSVYCCSSLAMLPSILLKNCDATCKDVPHLIADRYCLLVYWVLSFFTVVMNKEKTSNMFDNFVDTGMRPRMPRSQFSTVLTYSFRIIATVNKINFQLFH